MTIGNEIDYKIIAIYGSPRRGGNTDILMNMFLEGVDKLRENKAFKINVKKIFLSTLNISPCRECCNCSKTGECIIDDDMQKIYPKIVGC
ncbi:MAG: NAD(P)H-dependent oxidoreductase, partial [Actinobacteria bacterium]|nr:NAD(P)H-dependent oxidoreductase [Actinomycetota bacterium]